MLKKYSLKIACSLVCVTTAFNVVAAQEEGFVTKITGKKWLLIRNKQIINECQNEMAALNILKNLNDPLNVPVSHIQSVIDFRQYGEKDWMVKCICQKQIAKIEAKIQEEQRVPCPRTGTQG